MVSTIFHGELGNNLFQLAALLSLKNKLNVDYEFLNTREAWVSNETRPLEISKLFEYDYNFVENYSKSYEVYLHNDCIPQSSPEYTFAYRDLPERDNILLRGYFQSEKYFINIKNELINKYFRLNENTKTYIRNKYGYYLNNSIALHIRAGGDRPNCNDIFPTVSVEYYQEAINRIYEKHDIENVLIFSDNMKLAKSMFSEGVIFIENETAITDLTFMSMCSHNILGNSTFSWWGAYLNLNLNKMIVAPKTEWFGGYLSQLDKNDLFPSHWTTL